MAEQIDVGITIKGTKDAEKGLDNIGKKADGLGSAVDGLVGSLDKMTNGAVTGFRQAANSTKAFIKGLKLTRTAIIATGIGALVVGVVALVSAFASTRKAANAIKVGMAALGAIVERVTGYFQAAGSFIVGLFTGGTQQALENYNEEMSKLPGTMSDAIDKAMELERRTQALRTATRELSVQFAEGRAQIKEYNLIAEDTNKTLDERLEAAQKAIDIEKRLMAERQRIAEEELNIAREKAAQSDSSEEDLDNLAQLEVNLINIRTESAELQTTLNNKINTIRNEAIRKAREEAQAIKEAEEEKRRQIEETQRKMQEEEDKQIQNLRDYLKTEEELELEAFDKKAQELLTAEMLALASGEEVKKGLRNKLQADRLAIEKKYADQRQSVIDQATADAAARQAEAYAKAEQARQKQIAQEQAAANAIRSARISVVGASFDVLKALAKTEEGQRKLAVAQVLVNQGIAMSEAIRGAQQSATATGPGAVFTAPGFTAQMLAIVLGGFASIKGIMNQAGASAEGINTTTPSLGGGGGGGSTIAQTQLALTPDLAGSFGEGTLELPAVQAYVLQNDIASAQALQQELQNRASL